MIYGGSYETSKFAANTADGLMMLFVGLCTCMVRVRAGGGGGVAAAVGRWWRGAASVVAGTDVVVLLLLLVLGAGAWLRPWHLLRGRCRCHGASVPCLFIPPWNPPRPQSLDLMLALSSTEGPLCSPPTLSPSRCAVV